MRISRSLGVDLSTGDGLDDALTGVEAVVDTTSYEGPDHVLLSIVGVDRVEGNAHYAGKREQERLVIEGPVPWTIIPATQFYDFAATMTSWTEHDGATTIPPLRRARH